MNYNNLFKKVMLLISSPAKAWEEISLEEDKRKGLATFVYPMIGLCGMAVFASVFLYNIGSEDLTKNQLFQLAMTKCCGVFVALFIGYFLAAKTVSKMARSMFGVDCDLAKAEQIVGYAMVVPFVLKIIVEIVPAFLILKLIFQFYIIYIIWEGARVLLKMNENKSTWFSIFSSLVIIFCPIIIELIFNKLTVVLN
ncbi:YIP1 family protein [Bacteroides luti]|nr:YIP1 family protein [Bacteroides luti]